MCDAQQKNKTYLIFPKMVGSSTKPQIFCLLAAVTCVIATENGDNCATKDDIAQLRQSLAELKESQISQYTLGSVDGTCATQDLVVGSASFSVSHNYVANVRRRHRRPTVTKSFFLLSLKLLELATSKFTDI